MSEVLNQYFSSVFTHMNLTLPDADQVFREKEDERSTNLNIILILTSVVHFT